MKTKSEIALSAMRGVAVIAWATAYPSIGSAGTIPNCAGNVEAQNVQGVRVERNGTVTLADSRAIYPEGIILPAGVADRAPDALTSQVLGVINGLIHDKPVTITSMSPKEDRYGRIRAQIFLPSNATEPWLQVALLKRGLARVDIAPDRTECAAELLAGEAQARATKLGLWAYPAYVVRNPQNVAHDVGTFQVVEGKVVSAALRDSRAFLDFGPDWHIDFTVVISPDDMESFRQVSIDPRGFVGKTVRVRGWVEERDGPEMAVSTPQSIEIIPDVSARSSREQKGPMQTSSPFPQNGN